MKHKQTTITWVLLLIFTIGAGLISNLNSQSTVILILIIAALKFFGIAFQFMEIKKAHNLWKGLVIGFVVVFVGLVMVISN